MGWKRCGSDMTWSPHLGFRGSDSLFVFVLSVGTLQVSFPFLALFPLKAQVRCWSLCCGVAFYPWYLAAFLIVSCVTTAAFFASTTVTDDPLLLVNMCERLFQAPEVLCLTISLHHLPPGER
jgi:hypothetical protein